MICTCFYCRQNKSRRNRQRKRKLFNDDVDDSPAKKKENLHEKLSYEFSLENNDGVKFDGHRIVHINHFINELIRISSHESLFECSLSTMKLVSEKTYGVVSKFIFLCSMCKKEFEIKNSMENLNYKAVEGAMISGCGYAQLRQFTAALDLPLISQYTYNICHDEICQDWEVTAWEEMKKAGEREKEAAIQEGRVNKEGIPLIDVIVDGYRPLNDIVYQTFLR
ncbi:uncharacterized protein ACR2FA_007490 [Aphomia sociella]